MEIFLTNSQDWETPRYRYSLVTEHRIFCKEISNLVKHGDPYISKGLELLKKIEEEMTFPLSQEDPVKDSLLYNKRRLHHLLFLHDLLVKIEVLDLDVCYDSDHHFKLIKEVIKKNQISPEY